MKLFEVGKSYYMHSICDNDCVWTYQVIARTKCTVTLTDGEKVIKRRINKEISGYRNAETVHPLGVYSMCPVLSADRMEVDK